MDSDDNKTLAIALGAGLLLVAIVGGLIAYNSKLDAAAPVVESCIKHPSTKQPVFQ